MDNLPLRGQSGFFKSEAPVHVRKINENVSDAQIEKAITNNNLDEIVVENAEGEQFILYADELSVNKGEMPKVGDTIQYGGKIVGEVKFVDDESNESYSFLKGGLLGLSSQNFGKESDEEIQAVSVSFPDALSSKEKVQMRIATRSSNAEAQIIDHHPEKHVSGEEAEFFFVNGIMTSEEEAQSTAELLSEMVGKKVQPVHSLSRGFKADIELAHEFDVYNKKQAISSEENSKLYQHLLKSLLGEDKNVKIIAHSRGSSEVANVLWKLRSGVATIMGSEEANRIFNKIEVVTLGALALREDFPADVKLTQIANPNDTVTQLAYSDLSEQERYSAQEQARASDNPTQVMDEAYDYKRKAIGYAGKTLNAIKNITGYEILNSHEHLINSGNKSYLFQESVQGALKKLAD